MFQVSVDSASARKLFVFQVKSFSHFRQKTDRDSGKKLVVFQVSVDSALLMQLLTKTFRVSGMLLGFQV